MFQSSLAPQGVMAPPPPSEKGAVEIAATAPVAPRRAGRSTAGCRNGQGGVTQAVAYLWGPPAPYTRGISSSSGVAALAPKIPQFVSHRAGFMQASRNPQHALVQQRIQVRDQNRLGDVITIGMRD